MAWSQASGEAWRPCESSLLAHMCKHWCWNISYTSCSWEHLQIAAEARRRWMYLGGHGTPCSPCVHVAAIVSNLNPQLTASKSSDALSSLKQRLLWLLYDHGAAWR